MIRSTAYLVIALLVAVLVAGCAGNEQTGPTGNTVAEGEYEHNATVYFFWGDGCPHCAKEKPFLEKLEQQYPGLDVQMYETWNDEANRELFNKVALAYGTTADGVPTTFIGDEHWVGYSGAMGQEMEAVVQDCLQNGCESPASRLD